MPIFDQSYRAYTGTHTGRMQRLLAITFSGMRPALKKRGFMLLMIASTLIFVGQFVRLYLLSYADVMGIPTQFGSNLNLAPESTGAPFFLDFLMNQDFFLFVITLYVGTGLISDDLASGALPLYLSRPIEKTDYIVGKMLSIVLYGALVLLVPALLLWALMATKAMGSGEAPPVIVGLGILATGLSQLIGYSSIMLAISSLTKSRRGAGFSFIILFMLSALMAGILTKILKTPALELLNVSMLFEGFGRLAFGIPNENMPTWMAPTQAILLGVLILFSWLILALRVRYGSSK